MADQSSTSDVETTSEDSEATSTKETGSPTSSPDKSTAATPRKIPGNFPYLAASGTLKKAMERLIDAQRPPKYNADFLENVLKLSGGSARGTVSIMKKLGLVASDGTPTDLYAKFRTDSGRSEAAYQSLRNGFPEIFRRSEYAHTVDDNKLRDIVVEITGLKASDPVAQAIRSTFNVVKSFITPGYDPSDTPAPASYDESPPLAQPSSAANGNSEPTTAALPDQTGGIRLAYNINIVLPETSDLKVLNAIFKSIKENLMR